MRDQRRPAAHLHDVLKDAGPVFDPARRKDRLRFLIAVHGTDGHHLIDREREFGGFHEELLTL